MILAKSIDAHLAILYHAIQGHLAIDPNLLQRSIPCSAHSVRLRVNVISQRLRARSAFNFQYPQSDKCVKLHN